MENKFHPNSLKKLKSVKLYRSSSILVLRNWGGFVLWEFDARTIDLLWAPGCIDTGLPVIYTHSLLLHNCKHVPWSVFGWLAGRESLEPFASNKWKRSQEYDLISSSIEGDKLSWMPSVGNFGLPVTKNLQRRNLQLHRGNNIVMCCDKINNL